MDDKTATIRTLQAALAFADALIAHGLSIPSQWHNWLQFGENEQLEALKGQTDKLQNHRANLQAALDSYKAPVKA